MAAASIPNAQLSHDAAWTTYTPTWSSGGTAPTIGNGTLAGRYQQIGKTVHFVINLTLGSTSSTTGSTGAFSFTLPVTASSSTALFTCPGSWYAEDAGVSGYSGNIRLETTTTITLGYTSSATGAFAQVARTTPFTWANTDFIRLSGFYEAA